MLVGTVVGGPPSTGANAAPPPVRVYPLGDSITFGWTPDPGSPGGYRTFLDAALTHADVPHLLVGSSTANATTTLSMNGQAHHDGHNGYRIEQVDADLDGLAGAYDDDGGSWLTGTAARGPIVPDIVIVHLGTNDLIQRFDPSNTYDDREPLDEADERARFVASMKARRAHLLAKIHALRPGATVLLSTIIPIDLGPALSQAVADDAVAVRALVAERRRLGEEVVLVDAYAAFLSEGVPTPGLLSADGVHPTTAGFAVLGRLYADQVARSA
jgi:lysophospholipase L1-like esterase